MANIVITTIDANYIEMVYNDIDQRWEKLHIRRLNSIFVGLLSDDNGVEISFNDSFHMYLNHSIVDSVNGVSTTTNNILYTELIKLM